MCPNAVSNGIGLGTGRPGGYAERVLVDARMLLALPDELDDAASALEPLGVPAPAIVFNEVELVGALIYRRAEFAEAVDLLAAGRVPAEPLITGIVGLDRAEEMFQMLTAAGNTHLKVLLGP